MAARYLVGERSTVSLQTTALVNELCVRLLGWDPVRWQNRGHFYGVSARMMRRVLVDIARRRRAERRGGPAAIRVPLDGIDIAAGEPAADVLAVDMALELLAAEDPPRHRWWRAFSGLRLRSSRSAQVSVRTVRTTGRWRGRGCRGPLSAVDARERWRRVDDLYGRQRPAAMRGFRPRVQFRRAPGRGSLASTAAERSEFLSARRSASRAPNRPRGGASARRSHRVLHRRAAIGRRRDGEVARATAVGADAIVAAAAPSATTGGARFRPGPGRGS